jgi:ribosome biogenesis GTPase
MPGGGAVLDTPGVRLVGMFDTVAGLDRAFADVTQLATLCRFDDCRHGEEPGCAVRDAVEDGELSPRRFASWQKLQKEQKLASVRRLKRESRDRRRLARP